jgi:hypothetical protein
MFGFSDGMQLVDADGHHEVSGETFGRRVARSGDRATTGGTRPRKVGNVSEAADEAASPPRRGVVGEFLPFRPPWCSGRLALVR